MTSDLVFLDENADADADADAEVARPCWSVLVVDDDEDVHEATELALRRVEIQGRPLAFRHARSAAAARLILNANKDIAVVLLDVVMEAANAGLTLVSYIRETLGRAEVRIILRTGQPGYALELAAIRDYDINDYRTKGELTRDRLIASLTTAIRSYVRIRCLASQRRALETIVESTPRLLASVDVASFARQLIKLLAALFKVEAVGFACCQAEGGSRVEARMGAAAPALGCRLHQIENPVWRELALRALTERDTCMSETAVALFVAHGERASWVVCVSLVAGSFLPEPHLLQVLASHVAVCADKLQLVAQLSDFAYRDLLTGLLNRRGLIDAIDHRVATEGRSQLTLALADIDQFAEINDAFGHPCGDRLLQLIGHRLALADQNWVVARLGSDTFAVLGPSDSVTPGRLREIFTLDFDLEVEGPIQPLSVTIGLLRLAQGTGAAADMLQDANLALKQAKIAHRGREVWYLPTMGVEIRERLRLLSDLRRAFDEERLYVVYQPQVELATGRMIGAEALLRWRNDEGQFVDPDRFIPLAETSGLIIALGGWVLRQACRFQRQLHECGHPGLRIAVNVSVAQFRDPYLLDRVRDALLDSGIDPASLELELTESVAMAGATHIGEVFLELRELGVQLAIDDFGTGFSSLGYLQRLPIDRLKIDKSFVHELGRGPTRSIAEMVVQLGVTLGMAVVAEGVENEAQAQALRAFGCEEGQGFHFARPMPPGELIVWLQNRHVDAAHG
ncbi:MAG: EAL domain-containing protein [Burkholderiaceae bacterium]